ncbi:uncharacterized protein LOC144449300 [Glandiceps talaboti]
MPSYSFVVNCRDQGKGGGVGMYIHESLSYTVLSNVTITNAETLWIEVELENRFFLVGAVYKPPHSNVDDFVESLENYISESERKYSGCVIIGDFNIDVSKETNPSARKLIDTLACFHFKQTISTPTRKTQNSSSTIDHLYTNIADRSISSGTITADISDHFPIFIFFNSVKTPPTTGVTTLIRDYSKFNGQAFRDELNAETWEKVLQCKDVNLALQHFVDRFKDIIAKHAPLKCIRTSKKKKRVKPWLTPGILKSVRTKHKLFKKVINSRFNVTLYNHYKKYRNVLTTILRKSKCHYYANVFSLNNGKIKETWGVINELIGKSKHKQLTIPRQLKINCNGSEVIHTCLDDITEDFNNFYVHVGENLANKIPTSPNTTFHDFLGEKVPHSFFFYPVTKLDIVNTISALDIRKATGFDDIPCKLIHEGRGEISNPLCHIINLSFCSGHFPELLKVAKVLPFYKKGQINEPGNYRPISVLPVISKIVERIANKRLMNFLEGFNILYDHQYGFRKKYSCKLSLISLIQSLQEELDKRNSTLGIFIDFSKAFDTVNHNILLAKLEHYGIRGLPLKWFSSYLHSRSQYVSINNIASSRLNITCGVPQGSILGPILFLIYINDIPNSSNLFNFKLYADDSNLFHSIQETHNNISLNLANVEFHQVKKWCDANRLTMNVNKTEHMVIRSKQNSKEVIGSITLNDRVVREANSTSFIGIHLDSNLTWKTHIVDVKKKICKFTGIFYRLRQLVPCSTLLMLYNTFVLPHISYGLEVWGSSCKTYLKEILLAQKRIVRVITGSKCNAHTAPLFKKLSILDIYKQFDYQIGIFVHDVLHDKLPPHFKDYFSNIEHCHDTRRKLRGDLHVPKYKSNFGQSSVKFTGSQIWNNIPYTIRSHPSRHKFKKDYKEFLLLVNM